MDDLFGEKYDIKLKERLTPELPNGVFLDVKRGGNFVCPLREELMFLPSNEDYWDTSLFILLRSDGKLGKERQDYTLEIFDISSRLGRKDLKEHAGYLYRVLVDEGWFDKIPLSDEW